MPAFFFEVMVQRANEKYTPSGAVTLARVFKVAGLQHDRDGFRHENTTRDDEDQRLMDQYRHDAQRPAEGQRTRVAHKDLRRVTVEPEETEPRSDHRATKNRQLARAAHMRHLQILGHLDFA